MCQKRIIFVWCSFLVLQLSAGVSINRRAAPAAPAAPTVADTNTDAKEFFTPAEVFETLQLDNNAQTAAPVEHTTLPSALFRPLGTTTASPPARRAETQPADVLNVDPDTRFTEPTEFYKRNEVFQTETPAYRPIDLAGKSDEFFGNGGFWRRTISSPGTSYSVSSTNGHPPLNAFPGQSGWVSKTTTNGGRVVTEYSSPDVQVIQRTISSTNPHSLQRQFFSTNNDDAFETFNVANNFLTSNQFNQHGGAFNVGDNFAYQSSNSAGNFGNIERAPLFSSFRQSFHSQQGGPSFGSQQGGSSFGSQQGGSSFGSQQGGPSFGSQQSFRTGYRRVSSTGPDGRVHTKTTVW